MSGLTVVLARPLRRGRGGGSYLTEFELLDFERTLITLDVFFEVWHQSFERQARAYSSQLLSYFISWHGGVCRIAIGTNKSRARGINWVTR